MGRRYRDVRNLLGEILELRALLHELAERRRRGGWT